MLERLQVYYKQYFMLRFVVQFTVILILYFSIRYWKSLDNIQGVAPVIHDITLSGENFDLREQKTKPLLVHFWATWCPMCELENSNIASIAKDYQVITIASWSEGKTQVANYLKQQGLELPVIVDESGEWAKLYGVKAVPSSFVIDKQGNIQFIETGYTTEPGLRLRLWWLE